MSGGGGGGAHTNPVLAAIRERRSVFRFRPDPLPEGLLEEILEAGRWAPNHKLTEPWRFTLLGPETRGALTPRFAQLSLGKLPPTPPERVEEALARAREKWEGKPAVVVVSQFLAGDPFREEEDYASVACAIQNIQLAAWSLGVGTQWSTGGITRDPEAARRVGIPEGERVVGYLFLGYPALVPEKDRRPLGEVLRRSP